MIYPPPPPTIEYRVTTECDRHFVWSACDRDHLKRSLSDRGYKAAFIQVNSEYEQEIEAKVMEAMDFQI